MYLFIAMFMCYENLGVWLNFRRIHHRRYALTSPLILSTRKPCHP